MKILSFFLLFFIFQNVELIAQPGTNDTLFNIPDDCTFGNGASANGPILASVIQTDEKIIIGGAFNSFNGTPTTRLARINTDGTLDASFNPAPFSLPVLSVALQIDSKIIAAGFFSAGVRRLNSDGSLDPAFVIGTGFNGGVRSLQIQPDGKIIAAGDYTSYNGTPVNRIARLNMDGSLDLSFNTGSGFDNAIHSLTLLSDGKIIASGNFQNMNGTAASRVARLNTDGSLDLTFATGAGFDDIVFATLVETSGKVILGGSFVSFDGTAVNRLARLNVDGTLDPTFVAPGSGFNLEVLSLGLQTDGKILVGGWFTSYNGSPAERLTRLNSDGSLDNTFDVGLLCNGEIHCINLLADNKIIVGGWFTAINATSRNYFAKLHTNGALDLTFNPGIGFNANPHKLEIQSDNKIIVCGAFTSFNGEMHNHLVRLTEDGLADPLFTDGNGLTLTSGSAAATAWSILVQPDDKIIIGGYFEFYDGDSALNIVRVNEDGTIDHSFETGLGFNNDVAALEIQPDGKILVGGFFTMFNGVPMNNIARLNPDGSLDPSFIIGSGFNGSVREIRIQADNKILVGGSFTSFNGTPRNRIARLNQDGSLDTSFDPGTGFNAVVLALSLQTDGKIIAGGSFITFNGASCKRACRLNADGSLDASFVTGSGFDNVVHTIKIQLDQKILFGGSFTSYNSTSEERVVRLNPDGANDISFNIGSGFDDIVHSLGLQNNEKIIICGVFNSLNGQCRTRIARLLNECINSSSIINPISCGDYLENGITYSASGTYVQVIPNSINCDSTITINLTITGGNSTSTINSTTCNSFTENGQTYTMSGTYIQLIPNTIGCDSIITINLTIESTDTTITASACNNYTLNSQTYTLSGAHTQTLTNVAGCDSTIYLNLTILNSFSTLNPSVCDSFSLNGFTYFSTGTFSQTIPNNAGCDSLITINLNVISLDPSTSFDGTMISSNQLSASYQWVDCDDSYQPLIGETNQSFTPSEDGNYAVILSEGTCTDTSDCFTIFGLGISSIFNDLILIFPNPTTGIFKIENLPTDCKVRITNPLGEIIHTENLLQPSFTFDVSEFSPGIYHVTIYSEEGNSSLLLVKN